MSRFTNEPEQLSFPFAKDYLKPEFGLMATYGEQFAPEVFVTWERVQTRFGTEFLPIYRTQESK
jgi:hypothetical protein